MAYGEKYHVIYCDRNGKQFRLGIHEWDYTGASVRHKAAPSPFTITQETSSELKLGGIYPTRATVTLVSSKTFNMEELYTADERKYLVTHEPTDGSDQGKWYGNIIPNGFTEEMDNDVHYMVLTASDNLPTLKLKLFTQDDGTNYGLPDGDFQQSFLWVAKEAFKKTGFLLPIWTMVDVQALIGEENGVVLARRGHFNDVAPSEIGIFKEGVNFDFLEIGDRLTVSGSSNNDGSYTVTGFVNSVPPDSPYIRIQLDPQVPEQIHENVIIEIFSSHDNHPDPLAITVHDVRTYIADKDVEGKNYYEVNGSAMSSWDVLNNLAKQWNAKIYQNNGRWEIVRWNALAVDAGEYQYFVYNADGVQTGREDFGHDVVYPCKSTRFNFRPFGHSISMDRVLGAVGVNYRYKYKTDGDSLVNLIRNGNFIPFAPIGSPAPTTNPLYFTPANWKREKVVSGTPPVMLIEDYHEPSDPAEKYPPGIRSFITIGGIYHQFQWLTCDTGYDRSVGAGDELRIQWWQRVPLQLTLSGIGYIYGYSVIRVLLRSATGRMFYLINAGASGEEQTVIDGFNNSNSEWFEWDPDDGVYPCFVSRIPGGVPDDGMSEWGNVRIETPPCPTAGQITFEIVGVGAATATQSEPGQTPTKFPAFFPAAGGGVSLQMWRFVSRYLHISGVFIAKIVDPSSEAVPLIHPYWYTNDGNYTDQIDDIEVLLGDDNNPDHVSNIYVMDGGTRRATKSWDSWANEFGWGALGLTLAKSVMQQYYRPWRIIDGDFVAPDIHWASRIEFEQRPGERYALLRGTLDPIHNRFSGTIVQVADTATPELPPGGNDGGSTVDPNWQPTGTIRCVRDENGENTGDQEQLEVDMNPSSQTSGQQRWTNIGENTDACPIGEPIDFYWGASPLPIDPTTLEYFPYVKDGDDYTMQFDNDGSGKYLVFLWRESLGAVQSILDVELEETISSWVVESDVIINGYTYGVMRMAYMTGVFTGLDKTFKIN